jgi:hypothetical protein
VGTARSRLALGASIALVALGMLAMLGGASCINPHDQYDEYLVNTEGARGGGASLIDATPAEAQAIDGGFHDTYFAACLPVLAGGRTRLALRFRADVTYTPTSASSKAGAIDIDFIPLSKDGTTMGDVVGNHFGEKGAPVGDDGTFQADMGQPTIPAAGNPVSTNDIVFSTAVLHGILLGADLFCADLIGEVTSPVPESFSGGNYCILQRLAADAPLPALTTDQFHCP